MNLADIKTVENLLKSKGFTFKKSLGQNFLIDSSVCPRMAESFCDENCGVLEIGPGFGVLTAELAKRAKKVVAIELDERLREILPITLGEFSNVKIIFGDAMKLDIAKIIEEKFYDCESVSICANLPYYITSPLIMMLLEKKLPVKYITVMVQKEAAERLCAEVGSRESGAVTVAVDYYSKANILFGVGRNSFHPAPNVDSAVIQLEIRKTPPIKLKNEEFFFKFIKACFAQRRKTLVNTVSNTLGIGKDKIKEVLSLCGLSETVRSEQLKMEELASISDSLFRK